MRRHRIVFSIGNGRFPPNHNNYTKDTPTPPTNFIFFDGQSAALEVIRDMDSERQARDSVLELPQESALRSIPISVKAANQLAVG